MKIPLILSLLVGGAVGSKVISDNIVDNIKQETLVKDNEKSDDILTAYIDGDEKVYLNDIDDSEVVEDRWNYNEVKTVSVNVDVSSLDINSRYIEINIPLGVSLNSSIDALVDGKLIVGYDDSDFANSVITSGNTEDVYRPNSGRLKLFTAPNVDKVAFNLLLSIDDKFWCGVDDVLSHDKNLKAIIIGLVDSKNEHYIKVDEIKVYGKDWNIYKGTTIKNKIVENRNEEIKFLTSPSYMHDGSRTKHIKSFYYKVSLPKLGEGVHLNINSVMPNHNGNYYIIDNDVYFEWKNVYLHGVKPSINISVDNVQLDQNRYSYEYGEVYIEDYFSGDIYKLSGPSSKSFLVLKDGYEDVELSGNDTAIYLDNFLKNGARNSHLGNIGINNYGSQSDPKTLSIKFPSQEEMSIGVNKLVIPLIESVYSYDITVVIWNSETKEEERHILEVDNSRALKSYTLKIEDLVSNSLGSYFKSVEYDIGSLPESWVAGGSIGGPSSIGTYYGTVIGEGQNRAVSVKLISCDNSMNVKSKEIQTLVNDKGLVTLGVTSYDVVDEDGYRVSDINSNESFRFVGVLEASNYKYTTSIFSERPTFYIRIPDTFILNEEQTDFVLEAPNGDSNLKYVIEKSKVSYSGFAVYKVSFDDKAYVGHFSSDYSFLGKIKFDIRVDVPISVKSLSIDMRDSVFVMDDEIGVYNDGGWARFEVKDIYDLDKDGDIDEYVATIGESRKINIISNSNWLNTENSVDISGESQSSSDLMLSSSEDEVKYSINIDNSNEGYVRPGKFEYYIPVTKKDLEYNSNIKDDDEIFNFNMVLNERIVDAPGFEITYSYDNVNFAPYSMGLDLTKVSMIKIVNTEDINPNDKLQFSVKMSYEEGSWDESSDNDVVWSVYGNQVYEKNGGESGYLHVMDKIKLEIVKAPVIKENLVQVTANVNDSVSLDAVVDKGIPHADIKWQYRVSPTSSWMDLSETSETLALENVDYSMNGYQYRYEATNKGGSIVSNEATLVVVDNSSPIIKLTEIKDGENYKIRIDVTDEDNGVSHIILPDGTRINGDTYTIDAEPNVKYVFKAYDLAGNESVADVTIISGLSPGRATSNLDIYIKSNNMLSLSLDTNSINFDDFSGVEDVEKQNAVNLTVSSSLPYTVKAYLANEIQNADKSKTMDKSILNIKANSESTYETFSDAVTPIILLDNQIEGNDMPHGVDLKLKGNVAHEKDVYKTTIKIEVEQK